MPEIDEPVITLDIDWAPDFVIDEIAGLLIDKQVKATWFVTHQSEAVDRLREHSGLFELGLHPNMLAGSTHGQTEDQVLQHVRDLVPDAVSMRTHGLYQSSGWLIKAARDFGVKIDVSLLLPRASQLRPHRIGWLGHPIVRVPYFWEDDLEMFEQRPIWRLADDRLDVPGLRLFDFHPIHLVLNTRDFSTYQSLKEVQPVHTWDHAFIEAHITEGDGPRTLLIDLIDDLAERGGGKRVRDLVDL